MKTNASRFAAGLVFFSAIAPLPACAQFFYPPIVVVPPPAQNYPVKPANRPPPDKTRPADTSTPASRGGHYEGRTWVPD